MSLLGRTVSVRGEVSSGADLAIDGTVTGPVWCEGHAVIVGPSAVVTGDVIARDITVSGTVTGTLIARDIVDIRSTAAVIGRIVSSRLVLQDGALFHGDVQPQHVEAALTVARHRRKDSGPQPA